MDNIKTKTVVMMLGVITVSAFLANCDSPMTKKDGKLDSSSASAKNAPSSLVGKWVCRTAGGQELPKTNGYVTFNSDGTSVEKTTLGEFKRTWKAKGNILSVTSEADVEASGEFKIEGNTLTYNVYNIVFTYERSE